MKCSCSVEGLLTMKMKSLIRSDLHEDNDQESQSGVMLKGGGGAERVEGKEQGLALFLQ